MNSRVSLCVQELFHPQDSLWFLSEYDFPVPVRDPHYNLVLGFRLIHVTTLETNGSLRSCLSTLSPDLITGWWSEWSISWPEGVVNVEVNELEEVADKPGNMTSVLHCIRIPLLMRCDFWPLIHSYEYPCSSQSFPSDKTAGVSSRNFIVKNTPNSLTLTVAFSFVCTSPLTVITIEGLHDFVKVSISESFKSFLLVICIDASESTTNSRSSGLRVDAGRHLCYESEKNVALWCSFNLNTFLVSFHAASRAHRSCHSVFFFRPILKFWGIGVSLMKITWTNYSKRWFLVSNVILT